MAIKSRPSHLLILQKSYHVNFIDIQNFPENVQISFCLFRFFFVTPNLIKKKPTHSADVIFPIRTFPLPKVQLSNSRIRWGEGICSYSRRVQVQIIFIHTTSNIPLSPKINSCLEFVGKIIALKQIHVYI